MNYIIHNYKEGKLVLTERTISNLRCVKPVGCPFIEYSLLDLLKDFVAMYSWKISGQRSIKEFISQLIDEGYEKAIVYGNAIIESVSEPINQ